MTNTTKTIIDWLYSSKTGEWTPLTLEWVRSGRNKYFYDGNNGDKWQIITKFGFPVSHIMVCNLSQSPDYLRMIDLKTGDMYGEQGDTPLSNKFFS